MNTASKKPNILFISSWYPHKYRPLLGIFVKRHAIASTFDCNVSAIFICSGEENAIEECVEDGIYTIRGYYKVPELKIVPFFQLVKLIRYSLLWRRVLLLYKSKRDKPDLINANIIYPVSIIAAWLKMVWGVPYIITEHWSGYFPRNNKYKGIIQKIITRIVVANAGAVVTVSNKLSSAMQAVGLKNRYFTIPNVVDPNEFSLKPETSTSNPNCFNFIHISSLDDKAKNITGMLRTFKKFHALHPLSKFTIIWDEEMKELLDEIKEPFLEEDGIFLQGKKMGAELVVCFQKADVFILFSNYETQSIVLLEALCCGIPVISSRCGGPEEFITDKNGLLVDVGNEGQLLTAMEQMMKNKSNYNKEEIRNTVANKVSYEAVSRQFADVYKTEIRDKR